MSRAQGAQQPKVCIIGLDGATLNLIKPWAAQGKLPTLQGLLSEGTHGQLLSTIPPVTAPAWTSFMTGKNPGKHGLYHFIEPQPQSYELRYTNARSRLAKTLWQLLSEAGCSVGVVNVPMTYPPEPVNGYMISGLDAPEDSTAITYPQGLFQELRMRFAKVSPQVRYLGFLTTDQRREVLLQTLAEMDDHYLALMQYLMHRHPVDVMMIVFTSIDTVQHFFWQYMDPEHPQYDPLGAAKFGGAILNVYQKMDDIIGKLTANLPEETAVVLMSDHGAAPTSARVLYLNRYLAELGVLKPQGENHSAYHPRSLSQQLIKKTDAVLRRTLTPHQKAKVAGVFPQLRRTWEARSTGLAQIDWRQTKAYGYEVLTFPASIWINLRGLRPQGIVNAGTEYERLVQFLRDKLSALHDPITGEQLVRHVYHKADIYHGPYVDQAPDLTLQWWGDRPFLGRSSVALNGSGSVVGYVGGQALASGEWSGGHALAGMVVLRGKPFRANGQLDQAAIIDLAPTLLYLLGLPIPEDMDGRVLREAFREAFVGTHRISTQQSSQSAEGGMRQSTYSEAEARKVAERLRSLGYIE